MIRNIQLKHAGKYVCSVQTSVDQLTATAALIVRGMGVHSAHSRALSKEYYAARPLRALSKECLSLAGMGAEAGPHYTPRGAGKGLHLPPGLSYTESLAQPLRRGLPGQASPFLDVRERAGICGTSCRC